MTKKPQLPQLKPSQIRIRIPDTDAELLDKLAGRALSRTDIASYVLSAALDAIRENEGKVSFPPKFCVDVEEEAA